MPDPGYPLHVGWFLPSTTLSVRFTAGSPFTRPFAEPLYGEMDDTGLAGNSVWVTGGRTTNRGCAKRLVWKVKNSATGSSGDKSAARWLPGA
ncbi:hypothetical protein ACNKHU_13875 [Shigella flexneri]